MRMRHVSLLLAVLGLFLILFGVMSGDFEFFIFIIFPVIRTSSPFIIAGFLVLIAAFFIWINGIFETASSGRLRRAGSEKHATGIVLIGPIPIIFSTENKKWALLEAAILLIIVIVIAIYIF